MDLETVRREYRFAPLNRKDLADSPVDQFHQWMREAMEAGIQDPTAMCLATVGIDGKPSQRTVLLKQFDSSGFVFFTNMKSRKAKEIDANNAVALHFSWLKIDRQVCIEGRAHRLSLATVLKYFISRPRESQLAAWSSAQSEPLEARSVIEAEFRRMQQKFFQKRIPLPDFWGGFKVVPSQWEYWQGGEHRLHDRFQYTPCAEREWQIHRLAP